MKIIKQGLSKEKLEKKLKQTKRFECKTCGCIFEADEGEYEYEDDYIYSAHYCKCPNCDQRAKEVKMREIESTHTEKKPKSCFESSCRYHMGSNRCQLAFPPGTSFEKMLTCPYYTRREEPAPGAFSERDKG